MVRLKLDLTANLGQSIKHSQRCILEHVFHPLFPSAVSRSLSFREESQVIADVREDSITKQIKEATEGSVEIVVQYSHLISVTYFIKSL